MVCSALVLEDDGELRDALTDFLKSHSCRVFAAPDGSTALAFMDREEALDILTIEISMLLDQEGQLVHDVVRRAICNGIPVLFLAARPRSPIDEGASLPEAASTAHVAELVGRLCMRSRPPV